MSQRKNGFALRFPCECVSVQRGYSDPWAGVTQNKLLMDGTKERVLNAVARRPKTIALLAKELGLSQPTVHSHVNGLLNSELLCESAVREKKHPAENYYEPNFPVIKAADRAAFEPICQALSKRLADLFESQQTPLKRAMEKTGLADQEWEFSDLAQYLYACVQRGARELLEERGVLPLREKHKNDAEWLFWAEEANSSAAR
jgi:DNA-binding transcriptional ArsR family regulator